MKRPVKSRYRLYADVPQATGSRVRETAGQYYRGVVSEAVTNALEAFDWIVDARRRGKRIIATDAHALPERFEELIVSGLASPATRWTWLVEREHPWRRQLWLKGRNLTAGSVARTASTNGWSAERTAEELSIPIAAVVESIRYGELASDLIDAEEAEDRLVAQQYEHQLGVGVDRSQIRELLRLTPGERARLAAADANAMPRVVRRAARRAARPT
jgi:hypothetical protein